MTFYNHTTNGKATFTKPSRRDPNRIPRIIEKLKQTWTAFPDLRFNQLISSINSKIPGAGTNANLDFFNTEDDKFEKALDDFMFEQKLITLTKGE